MEPVHFRREFRAHENAEAAREIHVLDENRHANAEAAWRIGRFVKGYDRVTYWPHLHQPHDELVEPMYFAKAVALGVGVVFAKMVTEQFMTEPTLAMQLITVGGFVSVSQAAESAFCAWKPLPERFERGAHSVVVTAAVAAVPVVSWLLMRVPETPLAALADSWEGVALVGSELSLLLFGAAAGAAARAYRWSRSFVRRDVELRDRLIELGAELGTESDRTTSEQVSDVAVSS